MGASSDVESLFDRYRGDKGEIDVGDREVRHTDEKNETGPVQYIYERQVTYLLTWLVFQHLQIQTVLLNTDTSVTQSAFDWIINQNRY